MPRPGDNIGADNRAAVRALLVSHLGISRREIASRLGLSPMAVTRHVAAIRARISEIEEKQK
ncbi:winged helix-turn-helix transcriptional regulator [Xanthobacter autotrophicus]|uniref:winged helix-turn-helix transcriptional regulator n=1 Tax=Xanthobacter autotrophicus TaxID=280 RepID=UPI00372CFDFA